MSSSAVWYLEVIQAFPDKRGNESTQTIIIELHLPKVGSVGPEQHKIKLVWPNRVLLTMVMIRFLTLHSQQNPNVLSFLYAFLNKPTYMDWYTARQDPISAHLAPFSCPQQPHAVRGSAQVLDKMLVVAWHSSLLLFWPPLLPRGSWFGTGVWHSEG